MTRAREKLYLIGCDKKEDFISNNIRSKTSFFKIMGSLCDSDTFNEYKSVEMHKVMRPGLPRGLNNFLTTDKLPMDIELSEEFAEVKRRLDYEYAYKDDLNSKAKYSVSELQREANEARHFDNRIEDRSARVKRRSIADAANIGTAYHRIKIGRAHV